MRGFLVAALAALAMAAHAAPSQFPTAAAAFGAMNDYTVEDGTLAVESTQPLRLRISPTVVAGDFPKVIEAEVQRAAVYAVLRTFVHTTATQVQVTSVPRLLDIKAQTTKLQTSPRATVTVTRAAVEAALREVGVKQFADLVGTKFSADGWTPAADRLMYSDQGAPGVERFAKRIGVTVQR